FFFFSSRRRHTRFSRDWSSDVCSSDLIELLFRAANVWLETLETPDRAVRALEKVFDTDAQNATAASRLAPFYEEQGDFARLASRSEERRVGKECRARWWQGHEEREGGR